MSELPKWIEGMEWTQKRSWEENEDALDRGKLIQALRIAWEALDSIAYEVFDCETASKDAMRRIEELGEK